MDQHQVNFCKASLAEFLSVCSLGGTATLTFTTTNGLTNTNFNVSHGHPGSHLSPPALRPRQRGPAARERGRQRAACYQASQAEQPNTPAPAPAVTAPVAKASSAPETFASIVAKPAVVAKPVVAKAHKCQQCNFSSRTEGGLKIHVGKAHKRLEPAPAPTAPSPAAATPAPAPSPPAPASPASPPATTAPLVRPRKAMYYHPKDTCPPHTPPPPKCKRCGEATTWLASRIKPNKAWLHEFACHTCTDRTCLSTRTTLTTPPIT